jgi:ribosome maturation factor RimP
MVELHATMYAVEISPFQLATGRRTAIQAREEDRLIWEIWDLLQPVVSAEAMEIIEIEYRRESIGWVLRIYLDSERGVTVEDCARVSRTAGDVLDVADLIQNSYHLEVSSPGLDRPLRMPEQFRKHIGDVVEVRTIGPVQSRRNFKGTLKESSSEDITVECDGKDYSIPLTDIERARLHYFESMERKSH